MPCLNWAWWLLPMRNHLQDAIRSRNTFQVGGLVFLPALGVCFPPPFVFWGGNKSHDESMGRVVYIYLHEWLNLFGFSCREIYHRSYGNWPTWENHRFGRGPLRLEQDCFGRKDLPGKQVHGGHAAYVLAPDAWRTEKVCSKRLALKKWAMKKLGLLVVLVIQGMKYYIIYTVKWGLFKPLSVRITIKP